MFLDMRLDKCEDALLHLRRHQLHNGILRQHHVREDMLDGIVQDGGFHGGKVTLCDKSILILWAIRLLHIGSNPEVELWILPEGFEHIGKEVILLRGIRGDNDGWRSNLPEECRELTLRFL